MLTASLISGMHVCRVHLANNTVQNSDWNAVAHVMLHKYMYVHTHTPVHVHA